jgi:hypothetical protein
MKYIKIAALGLLLTIFNACSDYLDIVPDNVATIDYAFRMRSTAEKYLFTCYSFLPDLANAAYRNPGMFGADEFWFNPEVYTFSSWSIAQGLQNINSPLMNYWTGGGAEDMWTGISQCNIFLENIASVPDMDEWEKNQWAAEVKFLKAYYHFWMVRAYGPIPIIRENLPISASGEEVRVHRQPVDSVYNYIVELLDESIGDLPDKVLDETSELGRITVPIALGMKAKILTYAASPLFNGNVDYQGFSNANGTLLFSSGYDEAKWEKAVTACEDALEVIHLLGHELYEFQPSLTTGDISDETKYHMNCRGTVTDRWNPEIIWANTSSTTRHLQTWSAPRALSPAQYNFSGSNGSYGVTLKLASLFYTKNGVPIEEDNTWNYNNRFTLRTGTESEKHSIKAGYTTAEFNFDREPRFYGSLGFDGGIWYGNGNYDDENPYWLESKFGQFLGKEQGGWHAVPGYWAKKLVHFTNTATNRTTYISTDYPWVMLRLGDIYLLYAEALNEVGRNEEAIEYVDKVRSKYGLPGVVEAWSAYSKNPNKPSTKEGLREIIRRERTVEFALEGERFWDLRRWKDAPVELNKSITGWDVDQARAEDYYRVKILFNQRFSLKDYFWPIQERDLVVNKNLVQNPGW